MAHARGECTARRGEVSRRAPCPSALTRAQCLCVWGLQIDDMGYSDLGCFGRKNVSTPHIDSLVASGVKFTQWISAAPICTPK